MAELWGRARPLLRFGLRRFVTALKWGPPKSPAIKPGSSGTVRMRVYASLISRSRFSAGGGCHFVYLAHERNEVFRRFWGFPPPIISCSLAASDRLMSASAASLLLYSSAVGTRTACGIRLHIAHLRGISVSFSLPISLPVFCSGVYCTAGSRPASVSAGWRFGLVWHLWLVAGGAR